MYSKRYLFLVGLLLSTSGLAHAEVTFNAKLEELGQKKLDAAKASAAERGTSYAYDKFQELRNLLLEFKKGPVKQFLESIDQNQLSEDLQKELEHEFPGKTIGRYDCSFNDVMRYLAVHHQFREIAEKLTEPFHWMLTTQEGPYTATDLLTFYMNPATGKVEGLIIIERKADKKWAPIGGFTQYFETAVESGIREAAEEVEISVPVESTKLIGVYDDPHRDARQHIVSFCYAGITSDTPKETAEAGQVRIATLEEIEAIPDSEWFAKDHKQMAIDAYKKFNKHAGKKMIKGFLSVNPNIKKISEDADSEEESDKPRRHDRGRGGRRGGRMEKQSRRGDRSGSRRGRGGGRSSRSGGRSKGRGGRSRDARASRKGRSSR
ncbi:MAG: NUDIX hydrolase [Epsilonproteobacteria bacterium]|nr:NUDIX hydrolase [Campylobacterota bacterium]